MCGVRLVWWFPVSGSLIFFFFLQVIKWINGLDANLTDNFGVERARWNLILPRSCVSYPQRFRNHYLHTLKYVDQDTNYILQDILYKSHEFKKWFYDPCIFRRLNILYNPFIQFNCLKFVVPFDHQWNCFLSDKKKMIYEV